MKSPLPIIIGLFLLGCGIIVAMWYVEWKPNAKPFRQPAPGIVELEKIWDLQTGRLLHRLDGHSEAVRAVAFSPNGKLAASGGGDMTVRIWRLPE